MTKIHIWACTSAGGCAVGFIQWSLPIVQWIGASIAIIAGIKALRSKK